MQALQPRIKPTSGTARSRVSNRSRILPGVDGRSATARRFRDICRSYELEAGDNVTEVERDPIRQAAGLVVRGEQMQAALIRGEPVNNDELVRISSTAKRLLETIRAKADKRKPSGPDLLPGARDRYHEGKEDDGGPDPPRAPGARRQVRPAGGQDGGIALGGVIPDITPGGGYNNYSPQRPGSVPQSRAQERSLLGGRLFGEQGEI
jgi:hypothetical protein